MVSDSFFSQENFMPHGMCYLWQPDILWTSVISDVTTALAYFSITAAVIMFVKKRQDLPYPWFFILAGSVIFVACGTSHLISAIVIWKPIYGISSIVKAITAVASLATGIVIWFIVPFFLKFPSPKMLAEKNTALEVSLNKLQLAHASILESQKLASLTHLMAGMAHELNTPMGTSITAASCIEDELAKLKKEKLTKSQFHSIIANIDQGFQLVQSNLKRSADLVSLFKEVAVIEQSSADKHFNLHEFISDLTTALRLKFDLSHEQVTMDCPKMLNVYSNPNAFIDIITNFFTNSVTHGFSALSEGRIKLNFENKSANLLTFTYSDNGCGMAATQVEKIYEPFFTTSLGTGGPGLGMTIVYNTISNLKGKIECSSDAGEGMTFIVELPLKVSLVD